MKALFICSLLFTSVVLKAQDTIIFKNGTLQNAKVLEVGTANITYKKTENLDGPNYVVDKNQIAVIQYANGTRDVMPYVSPAQHTNTTTTAPVSNPSAVVSQNPQTYNSSPSQTYVRPQVQVVVAPPAFYGGIGWGGWVGCSRPWGGVFFNGSGYRSHHGRHCGW